MYSSHKTFVKLNLNQNIWHDMTEITGNLSFIQAKMTNKRFVARVNNNQAQKHLLRYMILSFTL